MKEFKQIININAFTSRISNQGFLNYLFERTVSNYSHDFAINIPIIF